MRNFLGASPLEGFCSMQTATTTNSNKGSIPGSTSACSTVRSYWQSNVQALGGPESKGDPMISDRALVSTTMVPLQSEQDSCLYALKQKLFPCFIRKETRLHVADCGKSELDDVSIENLFTKYDKLVLSFQLSESAESEKMLFEDGNNSIFVFLRETFCSRRRRSAKELGAARQTKSDPAHPWTPYAVITPSISRGRSPFLAPCQTRLHATWT
ncbi:hypothetical protein C0J52_00708 [Blattella germanica]|nr:hypothetical protein C0J52_00708 [Blattella germanica]